MIIDLPGIVGHSSGGGYPPAGTWLSSVCSGPDAHDQGNGVYYDVNNYDFHGMFTLWEQFADGSGGSYWVNQGNNAQDTNHSPYVACWLPQYFYYENNSGTYSFDWSACGQSGNFAYGSYYTYAYSNGDGTTSSGGSGGNWYGSGYTIYDSGCCQVYFDGNSGYYVSDNCGGGCPSQGTYLSSGCGYTSGYDQSGQYWQGYWQYGDFYADGSCGQNFSPNGDPNSNGCWYPSGYWLEYSSSQQSLHWYVYDSCQNTVAEGDFTYYTSFGGTRADGSGGVYADGGSWSASEGQTIATGSYYDCDGNSYNYEVYSNGGSGYNVNTYLA